MLGQKIGHYRITRLIGKGGMGLVYEAVHEEIERRAAIKILLPEFTNNPEAASRFLNEARAVNIVSHPSLVNIFEYGRLTEGDGSAYIVMEYLEGETLRSRMERRHGPLGTEGLRLARQIASALTAAHAKRIVHRDLKPANVMLVEDADMVGGERVKVLDFGIAKLTEHSRPAQVETRAGTVLGSPTYMSPEQCRNIGLVDDRSDVYSLGVIIYEMFAGRAPFVTDSDTELMGMHMYVPVPPLHKFAPNVQPELEALIMRMLDKSPANRPGMQEVLTHLNRIGGFSATESTSALKPIKLNPSEIEFAPPTLIVSEGMAPAATLSSANGEGPSWMQRRRRTRPGLLIGGLVAGALLGTLVLIRGLSRRPAIDVNANVQAGTPIHLAVSSEPPGAEVWTGSGDRFLGRTPYSVDVLPDGRVEQIRLRLPGFNDAEVLLDHSASAERTVQLERAAGTGGNPDQGANPPGENTATDGKPTGKTGKAKGPALPPKKKKGIQIIN